MNGTPLGTLVISVDVEHGNASWDREDSVLAHRVATALSRADLKATLGVREPVGSRLADGLLAEFPQAELALVAEESWAAPHARRSQFAAGLIRSTMRATAAGYSLRSVVLPVGVPLDCSDLLVKQGISAVRTSGGPMASPRLRSILRRFTGEAASLFVRPKNIRFGLWEMPYSASLPGTPVSVLKAWIDRTAEARGLFHLRIDVPGLRREPRGMMELGRLVEHAAARRDQHRLRVATLSELAEGLLRRRAVGAQSILRLRAA